ncbi:MAG: DinB family protein [Pyrinomonadaceae bacterium]
MEINILIDELKSVHSGKNEWQPSLMESLRGINYEQAAARPIENAHNIWELVAHITGWEDVFRCRFEGQKTVEPEAGDFPMPADESEKAWTRTLEDLEDVHQKLLNVVAGFSDSILETEIAGKDYSFRFLLRETAKHKVYHSGQISLLKKAFGEMEK